MPVCPSCSHLDPCCLSECKQGQRQLNASVRRSSEKPRFRPISSRPSAAYAPRTQRPSSLLLLSHASPSYLAGVLTHLAQCPSEWRLLSLTGRVKAKVKGPVAASKLRTILPLPALVGALDYIIATRLNTIADRMTSDIGFGCLEAAKKRRQVLDIAFPAAIAIERGLDCKSKLYIAQSDIHKYYDSEDAFWEYFASR